MSQLGSIGRRPDTCCVSGERFVPNESIVAALVEQEPGADPVRCDTRLNNWVAGDRPPGVLLGWWRTTARVSEQTEPSIDASDLVEFVMQPPEPDDTEDEAALLTRAAVRYLVTLELVRRRKLELLPGTGRDATVRVPTTAAQRAAGLEEPEPTVVPAVEMDQAEFARVAEMLGAMVGVGE